MFISFDRLQYQSLTGGQRDRQTDRQRDRPTDIQTDRFAVTISRCAYTPCRHAIIKAQNIQTIEGCINDERQFNTATRSQAPCGATVLKRFSAMTSLLFVVDRKE